MTRIEVSAEQVAVLGGAMAHVADDLQWSAGRAREQAWSLGGADSASARALARVLGDFEHQRLVLGRALNVLAQDAVTAGRLYAEVELAAGATVAPPDRAR